MKIITETDRLILRELHVHDAQSFYELNLDPEVMKYTGDHAFDSVDEAQNFLSNYAEYQKNNFGRWAVIQKESKQFIGWCGLKKNEQNLIDIGFRFFKQEWGKGYATEAAKATLDHGFHILNINEIIGRAATANKASIRVLEKIGMQFWKQGDCLGIDDAAYFKINREQYLNS